MKLKINLETIKTLNPCKDRLDNYIQHYGDRNFTLRQFLALDNITHKDKLWVALRLVDDDTRIVFALDCSFSAAAAYAAAAYASADAADAAAYAAYAADADASAYASADAADAAAYASAYASADAADAVEVELERQLEALIYLIEGA